MIRSGINLNPSSVSIVLEMAKQECLRAIKGEPIIAKVNLINAPPAAPAAHPANPPATAPRGPAESPPVIPSIRPPPRNQATAPP